MTRLLLLFSLQLQACYSQCEGPSKSITGKGNITWPNLPNEYGKKVDCVWKTLKAPHSVTTLRIVKLKLVAQPPINGGTPSCGQGAHKLLINGEQISSELNIHDKREQACYSFLNQCEETPDISDCRMKNNSKRVTIKYIGAGCTEDPGMTSAGDWGFKIQHETISCLTANKGNTNQGNGAPTETITPHLIPHSHTATIRRPTQEERATSSSIRNNFPPSRSASAKYLQTATTARRIHSMTTMSQNASTTAESNSANPQTHTMASQIHSTTTTNQNASTTAESNSANPQTATTASQIHSTITTNQYPPATAESNPAAIIGVIVGILFITGAGIVVIYVIRIRQQSERKKSNINEPEGQGHPNRSNGIDVEYAVIDRTSRSEHEQATTSHAIDQSDGVVQNTSAESRTSFAAYAEVDRKAKRQSKECKARLDEEKEMASHASDQSCVESPDSTTVPVYAQVDLEARRRAKESRDQSSFPPPSNQAVEAAYSSVVRGACGAKATVHMDY